MLAGLLLARDTEVRHLLVFVDSQLVANQIKGSYEARQPTIKQYLDKAKEILNGFASYTIEHVKRNQNKKADALSKLASMSFAHLTKEVLVELLAERSIQRKEVSDVIFEEESNWMTPIREYLISGILPEDPKLPRKVKNKGPQYKLIGDNLYRRSFLTP